MMELTSVSRCVFPQVLLPLNGPGFEEQRAHMLIGVIVRAKSKRVFDHTTGNWKVVSGGQTVASHKVTGKCTVHGKFMLKQRTYISAKELCGYVYTSSPGGNLFIRISRKFFDMFKEAS